MILLSLALSTLPLDEPAFVEVGETLLPEVRTTSGSAGKDYILEVNGGGLVVEDFDGGTCSSSTAPRSSASVPVKPRFRPGCSCRAKTAGSHELPRLGTSPAVAGERAPRPAT